MKLMRHTKRGWQYHLHQSEADILAGLLKKFPFTDLSPSGISKTDDEPAAQEREKLLHESLADHRRDLKRQAAGLLGKGRLKKGKDGWVLTLDHGSREILLQILNDIRVGLWHALGEPEDLEKAPAAKGKEPGYRHVMDLAAYFQVSLIEAEP